MLCCCPGPWPSSPAPSLLGPLTYRPLPLGPVRLLVPAGQLLPCSPCPALPLQVSSGMLTYSRVLSGSSCLSLTSITNPNWGLTVASVITGCTCGCTLGWFGFFCLVGWMPREDGSSFCVGCLPALETVLIQRQRRDGHRSMTSLTVREMQIKPQWDGKDGYYQNSRNQCWGGCGNGTMGTVCWWTCQVVQSLLKTGWQKNYCLTRRSHFQVHIPKD